MDDPQTAPPRMTVVGTGYLGATHAICMAHLGFEVLGIDVDERKVTELASGRVPFFEPGLEQLLQEVLATGRLRFSTDFDLAAEFGDIHFVCVGTPQLEGSGGADLRFVTSAFDQLARRITGSALIVGKSTVPVGTAAGLVERVQAISPAGAAVEVAWNPEFLREGFAIQDTLHPDRLVFGVTSESAEARLRRAFAPVIADGKVPVLVADLATAELVKVSANAFLATKISFINAMAEICEAVGADVELLARALGHDARIGSRFLKPGLGFGGGCLPKDIRAFRHRAEELGLGATISFLADVDAINLRRRTRTVDLARELAGGSLDGVRVAALGAAFKPNSDDVRDAPALDVARLLYLEGASVVVYDPEARENAHRKYPDLDFAETFAESLTGADIVLLLTEWDEFVAADPAWMAELVSHRRIVDARGVLDDDAFRAAGWTFRALGRGRPDVFAGVAVAPAEKLVSQS